MHDSDDHSHDVHDRMPVILHRHHYETWLTAPPMEKQRLRELLVPFEAELMTAYEVSSLVNSPQNDTPACVERLGSTKQPFCRCLNTSGDDGAFPGHGSVEPEASA